MSVFERSRDMLDFGAYKPGANPELDRAVACAPKLIEFFKQDFAASQARATSVHRLKELLS